MNTAELRISIPIIIIVKTVYCTIYTNTTAA